MRYVFSNLCGCSIRLSALAPLGTQLPQCRFCAPDQITFKFIEHCDRAIAISDGHGAIDFDWGVEHRSSEIEPSVSAWQREQKHSCCFHRGAAAIKDVREGSLRIGSPVKMRILFQKKPNESCACDRTSFYQFSLVVMLLRCRMIDGRNGADSVLAAEHGSVLRQPFERVPFSHFNKAQFRRYDGKLIFAAED